MGVWDVGRVERLCRAHSHRPGLDCPDAVALEIDGLELPDAVGRPAGQRGERVAVSAGLYAWPATVGAGARREIRAAVANVACRSAPVAALGATAVWSSRVTRWPLGATR